MNTLAKQNKVHLKKRIWNGQEYYLRTIKDFDDYEILIGSLELSKILIVDNPDDEELKKLDKKIAYFVEKELLISMTDEELFDYIVYDCCDGDASRLY